MKKIALLTLTTLFSSLLFAQTTVKLDSILVSASRIETPIQQSGKSVTVLNQQQIAALPVTSVDELLRFVTGVNMNARNGFGVQSDFGMRGSTFSQVLVLVDNIRLNDPLTAHFNNNFPISVAELAQVEIIRGPASASYGPDAVGGVIHLKTKTYVSRTGTEKQFTTSGQVGFGENNLLVSDLGVMASSKKLQFSAGMKTNIADGETLLNPNFNLVDGVDSLFNNYFDLRTYTASVAYFMNDNWKVYARAGYDKRDFAAKYFYTSSSFDESVEKTESHWSQLSLQRRKNNSFTELNIGLKKSSDLFIFNPLFTPNSHTMWSTVVNLNHQIDLGEKSQLAVGTQVWNRKVESTDRGNHEDLSVGLYGVFSHLLSDNLRAIASLRLNYDENYDFEVLPQLSLSYFKENYTLRTSIGRTVRAADFTERFVSYQIPNLSPGRNIGNPDLKAENSISIEAGADYIPSQFTQLSGTVFYRTSTNLIDYSLTNSNDIANIGTLRSNEEYFYALNVADANTVGLELQAKHSFQLANTSDQIFLQGGYTYLSTSQSSENPSRYIANHPTHNFNFNVGYYGKSFNLTTLGNFIERDEEFSESIGAEVKSNYFVLNLTAEIKPLASNQFSMYINIQNLLETKYEEILGARMPGRWIMGGIKWNLGK